MHFKISFLLEICHKCEDPLRSERCLVTLRIDCTFAFFDSIKMQPLWERQVWRTLTLLPLGLFVVGGGYEHWVLGISRTSISLKAGSLSVLQQAETVLCELCKLRVLL